MVLIDKKAKCEGKNIVDSFYTRVDKWKNRPLVYYRDKGSYISKSYIEMRELVYDLASWFVSIGIKKGDKVAIYSANCWQWWVADLAIMSVGGVAIPIYPTNSE